VNASAAARIVSSASLLLLAAAVLVGCGGDSSELESENAALRTQLAQHTAVPPPVSTIDVLFDFCQAVGEFRLKRDALIGRFNELNATDQYFGSFTQSETQEILDLEVAARSVSIPLPPAGSGDGASRMNTLVLTLKAADERFVAAIRRNDYASHQAAREDANAAAEVLHQLYDSLCDDAR
jgi:hypothetical protein